LKEVQEVIKPGGRGGGGRGRTGEQVLTPAWGRSQPGASAVRVDSCTSELPLAGAPEPSFYPEEQQENTFS